MSTLITRDDAIRAGLCSDGVHEWTAKFAPAATAIAVEDAVRLDPESADWIYQAAGLDDYGDSYGDDGYGDGDSYSSSYGYGDFSYGDGDGYDYSYSYGDGGIDGGDGDGCGDIRGYSEASE